MAQHALPPPEAVTYWADEIGLIHTCESNAPLSNELLVWTLCDREVESGSAFTSARGDAVTCCKCVAAKAVLKRRAEAAQGRALLRADPTATATRFRG
jgi:hypothetical protein